MNHWNERNLGEILPLSYGKGLPESKRIHGNVPVYSSAGNTGFHDTCLVNGPSIVVGRKGSVGTVFFEGRDCFPIDTTFYTQGSNEIDLKFGYYALMHADLVQHSQDSAVPGLNRDTYSRIKILLPPLGEQLAIAEVLGALDDKIATNTKLADSSLRLAQTLFRAEVSSGVNVMLADSCDLLSRGIAPKYSNDDESVIVLNQKCVRDQRVSLEPARRTDVSKVRPQKELLANDVLVNSTGQGTLGRVARWTYDTRVTVDSHITIVRFDPDLVDPVCGGFAMLNSEMEITAMAEGSTGQTELSRGELGKLKLKLPAPEKQGKLGERLANMSAMENSYLSENQELALLRDTLLPQLMSGKLKVKQAEEIVASAV